MNKNSNKNMQASFTVKRENTCEDTDFVLNRMPMNTTRQVVATPDYAFFRMHDGEKVFRPSVLYKDTNETDKLVREKFLAYLSNSD